MTNLEAQADQARAFRELHGGPNILVMANAWDAASARRFEAAGFPAIATTSGGVRRRWAMQITNRHPSTRCWPRRHALSAPSRCRSLSTSRQGTAYPRRRSRDGSSTPARSALTSRIPTISPARSGQQRRKRSVSPL